MQRREFIGLVGSAAASWSLVPDALWAQGPNKQPRLAFVSTSEPLSNLSEHSTHPNIRAFMQELRALSYVEGTNLTIERYSGAGGPQQHPVIARRIVETRPDIAFATSTYVTALKGANARFPIVGVVSDPVEYGFGESLAHPGRNITGVTINAGGPEIFGKYLDLLKSMKPGLAKVALLTTNYELPSSRAFRDAARSLGVTVVGTAVETPVNEGSLRQALVGFVANGAEGVVIGPPSAFFTNREFIVGELGSHGLAAICTQLEWAKLGVLAAYAVDMEEVFRTAARYVDRILKGANPAEMPFLQPTKWLFAINLKTAKALGIVVPPTLLALADEVIE